MTTTKDDLQFVLAGLENVDAAMRTGNMFAAGVAFAELRQSIRRAMAEETSPLDPSTTLDQRDTKPRKRKTPIEGEHPQGRVK